MKESMCLISIMVSDLKPMPLEEFARHKARVIIMDAGNIIKEIIETSD